MKKRGDSKIKVSRTNLYLIYPEDIWVIGYDTKDGEDHILFDERTKQDPNKEFVKNIKQNGVIEPVTIRRNGGDFECVAGRRRIVGARLANQQLVKEGSPRIKVPCLVSRGNDTKLFELNITTNMHRKPMTTMQCARMALRYTEVLGRSSQEAANTFGVSRQSIAVWLKLCDLIEEVQDCIDAGEFSATAAVKMFHGKSNEQQKAKLARLRNKTEHKPTNGRPKGPSRPTLRKLVDEISGVVNSGVHEQFLRGLQFVLGEISAEQAGIERFVSNGRKSSSTSKTKHKLRLLRRDSSSPQTSQRLVHGSGS